MRSRKLRAASLVFCLLALSDLCAQSRHLFLDPKFLTESNGVALHVNPPERREIVLKPDAAWEKGMMGIFLTVLDDGGKIRMWYFTSASEKEKSCMAYAESKDGIHFSKPSLGLTERDGSKANNLLELPTHEGNVLKVADAPAAARYLCVANVDNEGLVRFFSPDGIRWNRDAQPLLRFRVDTQSVTIRDEKLGRYVLYMRGWDVSPGFSKRLRTIVRTEATSLDTPLSITPSGKGANPSKKADLPRLTTEWPTVFAADASDPPKADVYNLAATQYPLDPSWYMAFPSIMDHRGKSISDGRLDVHFVGGRDGIAWHRYDRTPYVPLGEDGSPTGGMNYMGMGMIVRGDEIWQYGASFRTDHGNPLGRRKSGDGAVYRYVQRLDGFVSADFADEAGHAVTEPVSIDGAQLVVNVRPGKDGALRVGLRDENGREIPGYAVGDCAEIRSDSVKAVVAWRNQTSLSALAGRKVRVELVGKQAKIFSFSFQPAAR
jgi:hypothetical protein